MKPTRSDVAPTDELSSGMSPAASVPLCVDLDGTLVRSDMLWESFAQLLKRSPHVLALLPFWALRGRAPFKRLVAARVALDPATLPYHEALISHLREEKGRGRRILLVTAADQHVADQVALHVGLFDEVLASDGTTNLGGRAKAALLVARFGEKGFDYVGDGVTDLHVWDRAREATFVGASASVRRRASGTATSRDFPRDTSRLRGVVRILRPHQWVKNLIVFVPLITSHQILRENLSRAALLAFVAFCVCASSIYVLNDLLDIEADRHHRSKRRRPLASGALPISWAFPLGPALLAGGLLLAASVSSLLAAVMGLYVATSFAYSWQLKRVPLLDVFVLAGLYTLRLIAGHAATGIEYSDWLLAFSMFFFLNLALVKRYQEVQILSSRGEAAVKGRGYVVDDLMLLMQLGVASGYLSVLVLALYVSSEKVRLLYAHPTVLLLICPLFLFWTSRVWFLTHRGAMADDPVLFAMKDKATYLIGALTLGFLWMAS
jgi:4-hydroxybenzoate polyprenyltransferase/phosphoserine phosphatase